MKRDRPTWTAAPRPVPIVVMAGALALLASAGLFLINSVSLFYAAPYENLTATTVAVAVVVVGILSLTFILIPLLAAVFVLRGSRWPAFLATVFGVLMIIGVIGADPIFIAGAIAAFIGAALLWFPWARAHARATRQNRESQNGLVKRKPVT